MRAVHVLCNQTQKKRMKGDNSISSSSLFSHDRSHGRGKLTTSYQRASLDFINAFERKMFISHDLVINESEAEIRKCLGTGVGKGDAFVA